VTPTSSVDIGSRISQAFTLSENPENRHCSDARLAPLRKTKRSGPRAKPTLDFFVTASSGLAASKDKGKADRRSARPLQNGLHNIEHLTPPLVPESRCQSRIKKIPPCCNLEIVV
jgi:hypothetical protein